MQTSKNKFERAEVTLQYNLFDEKLFIETAAEANGIFVELGRQLSCYDGWIVLFLDKKKHFKCWYNVSNFMDIEEGANDIAGFAQLIDAKHIVVARLDDGINKEILYLDICWICELKKACDLKGIAMDDYLVVNENGWCSYKDKNLVE